MFGTEPQQNSSIQDIGIRILGGGVKLVSIHVERSRSVERAGVGSLVSSTTVLSGSRGIEVRSYGQVSIAGCAVVGPFQVSIALISAGAVVSGNFLSGASAIGVASLQEIDVPGDAGDTNNTNNVIVNNVVERVGGDCIQIQTDAGVCANNTMFFCGRDGIRLCGPNSQCTYLPPARDAVAMYNQIITNNAGEGISNVVFSNFGGPTNAYLPGKSGVTQTFNYQPSTSPSTPSTSAVASSPTLLNLFLVIIVTALITMG